MLPNALLRLVAQAAALLVSALALAGCRQDMQDQPKFLPLRPTDFFDSNRDRPSGEKRIQFDRRFCRTTGVVAGWRSDRI